MDKVVIEKVVLKCPKCKKKIISKNIEIDECSYNQYVITLWDIDENWFEASHYCEGEEEKC